MKKRKKNLEVEKAIKDTQIGDFAQFIDVLEVIENLGNMEEVKKDIQFRKKLLKEDIARMQGTIEQMENKKKRKYKWF